MKAIMACAIDGCEKYAAAHGFCQLHWGRIHRGGSPEPGQRGRKRKPVREAWCNDCDKFYPAHLCYITSPAPTPYSYCKLCWDQRVQAGREDARIAPRAKKSYLADIHPTGEYPCEGLAIGARDGWALIDRLREQDICRGVVRGWMNTVGTYRPGTDEPVQPRFERPGLAKLWSNMAMHWLVTGGS